MAGRETSGAPARREDRPGQHAACDAETGRLKAELERVTAERDELAGEAAVLRSRLSVAEGTHVR
jgi:hypothetical protein